jgi:hypothetical protein
MRLASVFAALLFSYACAAIAADGDCAKDAQLRPNLSYVDTKAPAFRRFRQWVDSRIAANDDVLPAADAVILADLTTDPKEARGYCDFAVHKVDARVHLSEEAIAAGKAPSIAGDSYLYVGPDIADLSLAYAQCATSMSGEQREHWKAFANRAVDNIWNFRQARWGSTLLPWSGWAVDNPANNYYYSFIEATMYWALASGDTQRLQELCTKRLPAIESEFATLPGGGSLEGTGYGTSHLRLFALYRTWLDATGVDLANANRHLTDSISYWIHATVPTMDRFAPIGDQSRVSVPDIYDYQRRLMLEARNLTQDKNAQGMADWWLAHISINRMGNGENFRYDLLPASSRDAPATQPQALSYYAAGVGNLFARSDWSHHAMWLAFVAGKYSESHAHQEQGAFTLFERDWLAVTENIWTHSGIQQGTETNNVVRFVRNGATVPQRAPSQSAISFGANDPDHGALSASADLTPAYSARDGVRMWKRSIVFGDHKLLVHDAFSIKDDMQAIFQVNVPQKPVIDGDEILAGILHVRVIEPKNAKLSVLDWTAQDPPDEFRSGWRIDIEGPRGSGEFRVELSTVQRK